MNDDINKKKSRKICSIYGCSSRCDVKNKISLFKFPVSPYIRKKWATVCNMGKIPINAFACSLHFIETDLISPKKGKGLFRRLRKSAIPSQKLPKKHFDISPTLEQKQKMNNRQERLVRRSLLIDFTKHLENEQSCVENQQNLSLDGTNLANYEECTPTEEITPVMIDQSVQVEHPIYSNLLTIMDIINSDATLKIYTGLGSVKVFIKFCKTVEFAINSSINNLILCKSVSFKCTILLTLMKLHHNLPFNFLSALFHIPATTCSIIFSRTIQVLSIVLKQFIEWPSRESIRNNLPIHFLKFKKTCVILDCTEIQVSTPSCLCCCVRLYSNYKSCYTIKLMVGISPSGLITFVSKVFGGRASDKFIFNKSGIIKLCEFDDAIMVDRGFMIEEECAVYGINIIRPPFLKNRSQFSPEEAETTKYIARARVHVERIIERMKNYKILKNKIEFTLLKHIDDILTIVCALVNLSPPVLNDDSF